VVTGDRIRRGTVLRAPLAFFLAVVPAACGMIWDLPEPLEDEGAADMAAEHARDDAEVHLDDSGEADGRADGALDVAQEDEAGAEVSDDGGDAPPIEDRGRDDRHPPRD
jgi:hypothetical protein